MKNIILFIISLLFSITSLAQNNEANELYLKGVKNLDFENYKEADVIFTKYINLYDLLDISAYYNLSISKLKQGDTCSFCHNIWKASVLGDIEADTIFNEYCLPYKEKLQKFYKKNDSLYSLKSEKNLSYNYLFDLAIYKSEVGNFCSLCKMLENDTSFSKFNMINDTANILSVLEMREFIAKPEGTNRWEINFAKIEEYILENE